jgi:enoyl-CoA hydratase/carnithine racemase
MFVGGIHCGDSNEINREEIKMKFVNLQVETADQVAMLTINRPKVPNTLDLEMLAELEKAITALEKDVR